MMQAGTETREERESKQAEMEALGADPDIYEKLTNSVAPSIWQMDDVKKGILCQLFGGSSKVLPPLQLSYQGMYRCIGKGLELDRGPNIMMQQSTVTPDEVAGPQDV